MNQFFHRLLLLKKVFFYLFRISIFTDLQIIDLFDYLYIVGPSSLFLTMITSFFISLVFSLQIVKEFLYLNAINLIGSIFAISFIREFSPVLTSIIIVGKVGSFFTSELATMTVTEQIDALFILGIDPISYLIVPRMVALVCILPLLNMFALFTGLMSSSFICFLIYNINSQIFFNSVFYKVFLVDLLKSFFKTIIFALIISLISCVWGLTTRGGSKDVGLSTTSSVVTCLIFILILDFILSYYMFDNLASTFQFL
uniref:ABC transporter permease n=1 Tax=Kuetzingia canaliculata TaxID=228262 RepID=A0A1Z1MNY5_KUECA|nr:hypothetical protein [Kuetzingia canaliculata]ARW67800.1 hypothetical protein [Kuetzingia canaliculata]